MDKTKLNENLTNLQIVNFNKTGLGKSTTGATTATCASYKLLAQLTTWNKMAAYVTWSEHTGWAEQQIGTDTIYLFNYIYLQQFYLIVTVLKSDDILQTANIGQVITRNVNCST